RNRLRARLEDTEEELYQERERRVYAEGRRREELEEAAEDMFVDAEKGSNSTDLERQVGDLEEEVEAATFCIGAVRVKNWKRNIQYTNLVAEQSVLRAEIENLQNLI
ncbi:8233_t:CDS:2, partial [Ambispora leptoticha]